MKYKRYSGEFVGVDNTVWRAEIWQEAAAGSPGSERAQAPTSPQAGAIGELEFDASKPIEIEWPGTGKEEVIQGSSATLRIISPGDRSYIDLYSVEMCAVRLDVYRDDVLYWRGTLDTEFYEEPYEMYSGYTVSLTFSDFGVLERCKIYGHDTRSLYAVISECLEAADLGSLPIREDFISTKPNASAEGFITLEDLYVSGDNFYDEDGAVITAAEIIEGILQPLGLRMIQRGGEVWVYDINAMVQAKRVNIEWSGDSQTLSADKVYNNVSVTWSPYIREGNLGKEGCWTEATDKSLTSFSKEAAQAGGTSLGDCVYTTYPYSASPRYWSDETNRGFTLWLSRTGRNAELLSTAVRYFKVVPQQDGTECEGVAVMYTAIWGFGGEYVYTQKGVLPDELGTENVSAALWRSKGVFLPVVPEAGDLYVKITLEMLLDPRANPFEETVDIRDGLREKTYREQWNRYGNFVYVPVVVKFTRRSDGKVYCWDNRAVVTMAAGLSAKSLDSTLGEWKEYTETGGVPGVWGYLAYYSGSDRENTAGVANGWAKNRPGINPHNDIITVQLSKTDGALLPYPDVGAGDLTVEVLRGGWKAIDDGCDFDKTYHSTNCEFWKRYDSTGKYKIRHIWFKLPEVEVVEAGLLCEALESEDYVYKAELAAEAQEDLEIDTICGSAEGGVALARGAYMDAGGAQVTELTREGITGQIEELLIGTLYSQYGRRHTVLSGEARLCAAGMEWSAFTDRAQAGKCFMLTSTVEDLRMGEMDAEFTEITADEYVSVKTESETDSEE